MEQRSRGEGQHQVNIQISEPQWGGVSGGTVGVLLGKERQEEGGQVAKQVLRELPLVKCYLQSKGNPVTS